MKAKIIVTGFLIAFLFIFPPQAFAAGDGIADRPPPLCLPGVNQDLPEDCQDLGPSGYLDQMAEEGIILPLKPLPANTIDPRYSESPFSYVRLNPNTSAALYTSLEEAINGENPYRYIEQGFNYASYEYLEVLGQRKFFMIAPGIWMRGGDTAGGAANSTYVGLAFAGTPDQPFGWVLFPNEIQSQPGFSDPQLTGRTLNRYETIQVYEIREVEGANWYRIGPEEWVEGRHSALVYPAAEAPEGVENGRWIEINLFEQTVSVYDDHHLVFATLVSTGIAGWWTQPGLFQIQEKLTTTPMSGAFEADRSDYYYLEDVPWTMYFDQSRALHGAYWHNQFGYERSHGCANLSPGDSFWLFNWAQVGDWVYVWDPSGETPTDPALYTAGGA